MADAFARWVRAANAAMIAVTASGDGVVDASLVGFHSQSSIEPEHYTVWLSKKNRTTRLARRCAVLGVHLLGEDQFDLAERLGAVTEDDDPTKLEGIRSRRHTSGAVLLTDCPTWFVGRIARRLPGGDHHGFVLEPIAVSRTTVEPLRLRRAEQISPGHPAKRRASR